jgi:hypothetical protein
MNKLIIFLIFGIIFSSGCGVTSTHKTLTWTDDGNPLIPVCGLTLNNCKLRYELLDVSTGITVYIPLSATSYEVKSSIDTYKLRVAGYDGSGNYIVSSYVPLLKSL